MSAYPYTPEQRLQGFFSRIEAVPFAGCWLWTGSTDHLGYARLRGGDEYLGHRFAYARLRGAIPAGACVLHRCDVPSCVNPDHLFLGTHQENMVDRNSKGRSARLRGELNGHAKLTEDQVREILASTDTHRSLARRYGVTHGLIGNIKAGRVWKHVGL